MNERQIYNRVTIQDVARAANVSAGTVSNALTGKRPVADATRARIMSVIDELGYRPNLLARGLVNRSSGTLGVVTSGLEYYGPSRTLVGIEAQANRHDYSLLLELLHSPVDADVEAVLADMVSWRVDGIIWAVHEIGGNRDWLDDEQLQALPPIVFLTMQPRDGITVISTDNRRGTRLAVSHLIESGRRLIGHVAGPQTWWEARERTAAWGDTLAEHGLRHDKDLLAPGDWSAASGEAALRTLLNQCPEIDGIFAANDQMALGALRAAHQIGRRVPHDLAVVGYDNIPEAEFFWPSLTSVRQHLSELGRTAVEELQRMIEAAETGDVTPDPVVHMLEPELVVRESTMVD